MAKTRLTSRQRVLCALNHQEPDRVPFNLALTTDIYARLRDHLGLPAEPEKQMGIWTDVSPSLDLLDAMQVDIFYAGMGRPETIKFRPPQDDLLYDEWGVGRAKIKRIDGSYYYEMVKPPLANASLDEIESFSWPDAHDPGRIAGLRDKILLARRETDKAIMVKFSNSIWEQSWWLYGMQQWMIDLIDKPDIVSAIMGRVTQVAVGLMEVGMDAVGDLVDIVRLSGEDLGTQIAPMISPRMFSRLVQPHFARLWGMARKKIAEKNPHARLMLHSCGNVRPFIPTWIEMGLDILDPIQPRATGMEPNALKRDFGRQLSFHGGIDIQQILPFGTPQEVMDEVHQYMLAMGPEGGYIVSPAHNVQSDVPARNLTAIRDAIAEYGIYPLR